jgi:NAD(P)-dependent dehydrogenase (short-subunit alcohol dehydrogenase family)
LHARSRERAAAIEVLARRSAGVVVGDLRSDVETRAVADQINAIGQMDAVIHNAGACATSGRSPTPEGHSTILAVNRRSKTPAKEASDARFQDQLLANLAELTEVRFF